jgi:CheY-like chemotaxis protein
MIDQLEGSFLARAKAAPVGSGCHSNQPTEHGSKITLITEAHLLADFRHRLLRFDQQSLSAFNPAVIQVGHKRLSGSLLEKAHEVRVTHPTGAGGVPYLDRFSEMLAQVITIMGYAVIAANSGEEALRLLDQATDVALAVCDIRLPGMDGIAFRAVVRQRHPTLKVVFVTGDSDAADDAIRDGSIAMLKPYNFSLLTRVFVEALGSPSQT